MRRLILWSLVAGFTACLIKPTLVAITPGYGYVDGCTDVVVSGHDLGTDATAKLVNADLGSVDLALTAADADPDRPDYAQDVGFDYHATVGAAPSPEGAFYDVVVTVDGEELTIEDGWYYRSCPQPFNVDSYSIAYDASFPVVSPGASISFDGCGFTDAVTLQFLHGSDGTGAVAGTAQVVHDCLTRLVHFVVPALAPDVYTMQLVGPTVGTGTTAGPYTYPLQSSCSTESGDTAACYDLAVIAIERGTP